MWTRILALLAPGVFLFFTACSGGESQKPPQPKEAEFDPALLNNLYQQTQKAKQACAAAYQEPVIVFAQQMLACGPGRQPTGFPIPGNPGGPIGGAPIGGPIGGGPGNGLIPQQQNLAAGSSANSYYGAIPGSPSNGSVTGAWGMGIPQAGAPVQGAPSFDPYSVAIGGPGGMVQGGMMPGVPGQGGIYPGAPAPGGMVQGGMMPGAPAGMPFQGCGAPKIPQPAKDSSECSNLVKDVLMLFMTLRSEGKGKDGKPGKVVYYSTLPEAQAWLMNEVGSLLNQVGGTAQAQVPGLNLQDPAMANMLLAGAGNLFMQNANSLGPAALNMFSSAMQGGMPGLGGNINLGAIQQLMMSGR